MVEKHRVITDREDARQLVGDQDHRRTQTVTQFAIATLVKAAHESIQHAALTELSIRDRDVFLEMLDSDAEPNAALKKAAKRYRARCG